MRQDFNLMLTNGKMARKIGVDPKTLRKWARRGFIPSYINKINGYRYYFVTEVLKALKTESGSLKDRRLTSGAVRGKLKP